MSTNGDKASCRRCDCTLTTLIVRGEPLCRDCFVRYVQSKIIKRMEAFRGRHAKHGEERKLLLPISFGVSSVSLLHVLDRHLRSQMEKSGRAGYTLHVLFVNEDAPANCARSLVSEKANLKARYPSFLYSDSAIGDLYRSSSVTIESRSSNSAGICGPTELLSSLPSATARADVISILKRRAVVQFAKTHGCEAVLWGHSTTRLAEQVLSETAKGRGMSLPVHVTDGQTPFGVPFYFPMRDLLKKELFSYIQLAEPSLTALIVGSETINMQAAPSSKSTTIDDLMKRYFESVETHYPSIVSNVVRTSSRLEPKFKQTLHACRLCQLPLADGTSGAHSWSGEQGNVENESMVSGQLCYGCTRSVPDYAIALLP